MHDLRDHRGPLLRGPVPGLGSVDEVVRAGSVGQYRGTCEVACVSGFAYTDLRAHARHAPPYTRPGHAAGRV